MKLFIKKNLFLVNSWMFLPFWSQSKDTLYKYLFLNILTEHT